MKSPCVLQSPEDFQVSTWIVFFEWTRRAVEVWLRVDGGVPMSRELKGRVVTSVDVDRLDIQPRLPLGAFVSSASAIGVRLSSRFQGWRRRVSRVPFSDG